jgi:hypothetical protein
MPLERPESNGPNEADGGWFHSIIDLIDQSDPRSESFRQLLYDRVIQPIAQSALRIMLPYFASLIILLSITVILLAIVLYHLVNHSHIGPTDLHMSFLDFSDGG